MRLTRLLLRAGAWVAAIWLLLPVLQSYNQVILVWFNYLLDDSLVERKTFDSVAALHHELFWPIVVPRLALLVVLVPVTWFLLRRTRPLKRHPVSTA